VKTRFVVFEGVEGSGKSTQVQMLAATLAARGEDVVTTFEPGATKSGAVIRELLLDMPLSLTPMTEMFLFCADRTQHVHEVVRPALDAGKTVLSDRYELSTVVYQGYASAVGVDLAERLNDLATGGLHPDLTVVLDLDPAVGLNRNGAHERRDQIERRTLEFHQRVRRGFLWWAERHPETCLVLDALQPPEVLHEQVLQRLGLGGAEEAGEGGL